MKFNSTLAFILIFILITIGSGVISGLKGYTLGYEALKEISQPEIKRRERNLTDEEESSSSEPSLVSEGEILEEVNEKMDRSSEKAVPLSR
ncbi:MAG: hypothetical protein ACLFQP_09255 [Halothece sp.]